MKGTNRSFGRECEALAEDYFRMRGYKIICRNYRLRFGEIDLILKKDGWLVFVEVKARRSRRFGSPQEAVTPSKQRIIRRVAEAYLQQKRKDTDFKGVRFDVLAITFKEDGRPDFNHIPFAF